MNDELERETVGGMVCATVIVGAAIVGAAILICLGLAWQAFCRGCV